MPNPLLPQNAVEFVRQHGIVLESARGAIPSLAAAVAHAPMHGSWWSHPSAHAIFAAINIARESPDIAVTRLLSGKITLIHRRLWPAVVCLAPILGPDHLASVQEEHTPSGAHRTTSVPFPDWIPADVLAAAQRLSEDEAWAQIEPLLPGLRR